MKARHKRFAFISVGIAAMGLAAVFVFQALQSNAFYFLSPSDVVKKNMGHNQAFRLGGLVEQGTLARQSDGLAVNFIVTDNANKINVYFKGILPDLFKEGKGVIAEGKLDDRGVFVASKVLAKHDENYMPPEVAEALEKGKNAAQPGGPKATTM